MEQFDAEKKKNKVKTAYVKFAFVLRCLAIVICFFCLSGMVIDFKEGKYAYLVMHSLTIILFIIFYVFISRALQSEKLEYAIKETMSITALADSYDLVVYLELVSKNILLYRCDAPFSDYFTNEAKKILPSKFDEVMNRLVYSDDYDNFRRITDVNYVIPRIMKDGAYNADFRLFLFGKPVWYRARFVLDVSNNEGVLLGIKNINDEKIGSVELRKQESVFRHCLDYFSNDAKLDEAINRTLETIARFYEADRAYIFEFNRERTLFSNTYEYCRSGVTPEIKNLQNIDIHVIDNWIKEFEEEGAFFFSSLSREIDRNSLAYKILEPQGIESLIAAPLRTDGTIVGFVGIDNPSCDTDEKFLIRAISAVIYTEIDSMKELVRKQNVVDAMMKNFLGVYFVDLKTDSMEGYKYDKQMREQYSDGSSYRSTIRKFIDDCVDSADVLKMKEILEPEYIRRKLTEKEEFSVTFTDISHGNTKNVEMSFIRLSPDGLRFVITASDRTKEKDKENSWSQRDIEYKVQLTRLKRKEIALKQALIKCCSGYMDVNVTKNIIIGNLMSKSVTGEPETWVINSPDLKEDFTYDEFEKWWTKKYIISDKEEYYNTVCTDNLLNRFDNGQLSFEYNAESYLDGVRVRGTLYFYLSREVETGDVMALITVKNL